MSKNLISLIYRKLGKKKVLKEKKMNDENLTEITLGSTVNVEEEMEEEMCCQVKQMKGEFNYLISSIIRKYIYDIITKLMKENEEITEEQVANALGWFVNTAYRDMLKEIKDWVCKNEKELIASISNVIKDYIDISKNKDGNLIDNEINKATDKCMNIYVKQIKELIVNQIKLLKEEIDKSIGGQLVLNNKEFEANGINIVILEKKLKKYTNEIMNDFAVKNRRKFKEVLEDVSKNFEELKEEFFNGTIIKGGKTLNNFKEIRMK